MNGNTKRRLGRHRRSVIIQAIEEYNPDTKTNYRTYKVVGPGVRGEKVDSAKLRRESGKRMMSPIVEGVS